LLAPIAPHITEELWHRRGHTDSVHVQAWPDVLKATTAEDIMAAAERVFDRRRAVTGWLSAPQETQAEAEVIQ
jgi:leucyl-tRNA synthetase